MLSLTIVTVAYNNEETIVNCLESVSSQQVDFEHLVIDGLSTDQTVSIARQYSDSRVKIISEPDQGIYDAMNKGIKLATGEVIGILNADDFYSSPTVLDKVAALFGDPSIDAVYGDLLYVDNQDTDHVIRYWKSGAYHPKKFYWGWMPPHPVFFVRRTVYEKFGLFNLQLGSAADYEIMLRFLLRHQVGVTYLPEILVKMRVGGASNAGLSNRLKANRMDRKAWEVNGLRPYPWTLSMKPVRKIGQWFSRP